MNIEMRRITSENVHEAVMIWNKVVEDGVAFPQTEPLDDDTGAEFFASQDYTAVAFDTDTAEVVGMYILHPNNVGRCGHICNASYAVRSDMRGKHIGELLVTDCLKKGKGARLQDTPVQCGSCHKHLCPGALQEAGLCSAGRYPGRIFNEGRSLRGYHRSLSYPVKGCRTRALLRYICVLLKRNLLDKTG